MLPWKVAAALSYPGWIELADKVASVVSAGVIAPGCGGSVLAWACWSMTGGGTSPVPGPGPGPGLTASCPLPGAEPESGSFPNCRVDS